MRQPYYFILCYIGFPIQRLWARFVVWLISKCARQTYEQFKKGKND